MDGDLGEEMKQLTPPLGPPRDIFLGTSQQPL